MIILVAFDAIVCSGQAPHWLWASAPEVPYSTVVHRGTAADHLGNVYAVGTFNGTSVTFDGITLENVGGPSSNSNDVFLVKYNTNGTVIWATSFGSVSGDWSNNVCTDASGNVYVTGNYFFSDMTIGPYTLANYGYSDAFIAKFDSMGNVIWAKNIYGSGAESVSGITVSPQGYLHVTGSSGSGTLHFGSTILSDNVSEGYIAKYALNGTLIWAKKNSSLGSAGAQCIDVDIQGNIYLGGEFSSDILVIGSDTLHHVEEIFPFDDLFVAKYNSMGNPIWARMAGGDYHEVVKGIAVDDDQNVYITGHFSSTSLSIGSIVLNNANWQTEDILIAKYDGEGFLQWAKRYGGNNDDHGQDILIANNGDIVVTGNYSGNSMNFDSEVYSTGGLVVARFNSNGDVIWVKSSLNNSGFGGSISQNQNGEFFVSISTGSNLFPLDNIEIDFSEVYLGTMVAKLSEMAVQLLISEVSCSSGSNGTATATVFYGQPPYYFEWNTTPPQYGNTAINLSAGEYLLTVSDSQNNTVTIIATIPETAPIITNIEEAICEGEQFEFDDQIITEEGIYSDTLTAVNGCDSVVQIVLTILSLDTLQVESTICPGDSILVNGTFVTEPGSYYQTHTSSLGCDSVIAYHLTSTPSYISNEEVSICENASYVIGESIYNSAGIYSDTLLSIHGCDSLVITDLTVFPIYTQSLYPFICEGDAFLFNESIYIQEGTYYDTLLTIEGCDSIFEINLSVHPSFEIKYTANICANSIYIFNDEVLDSSGIYYNYLVTDNDCDSVEVLNLQVHSLDTTFVSYSFLEGEPLNFFGNFYSEEGTYYHTMQSMAGCDSTIVANLKYKPRSNVWVPNAFIPNSEIPENRVFKVQGTGIESIDLKIFNRRGEMIFESQDLEFGWDGKRGGEPMPIDVYIYRLIVLFQDGTIDSHEGFVTIMYH